MFLVLVDGGGLAFRFFIMERFEFEYKMRGVLGPLLGGALSIFFWVFRRYAGFLGTTHPRRERQIDSGHFFILRLDCAFRGEGAMIQRHGVGGIVVCVSFLRRLDVWVRVADDVCVLASAVRV